MKLQKNFFCFVRICFGLWIAVFLNGFAQSSSFSLIVDRVDPILIGDRFEVRIEPPVDSKWSGFRFKEEKFEGLSLIEIRNEKLIFVATKVGKASVPIEEFVDQNGDRIGLVSGFEIEVQDAEKTPIEYLNPMSVEFPYFYAGIYGFLILALIVILFFVLVRFLKRKPKELVVLEKTVDKTEILADLRRKISFLDEQWSAQRISEKELCFELSRLFRDFGVIVSGLPLQMWTSKEVIESLKNHAKFDLGFLHEMDEVKFSKRKISLSEGSDFIFKIRRELKKWESVES